MVPLIRHRRTRRIVALAALTTVLGAGALAAARLLLSAQPETVTVARESWVCPMHPDVRQSEPGRCPICGMALEREGEEADGAHDTAHGSQAVATNPPVPGVTAPDQAADTARVGVEIDGRRRQLIGVRTAAVERRRLARAVRAQGAVQYDEARWTDVTLRMEGYVRRLYVNETGRHVRRGQPLLALYSPELATALAEYRLAMAARTRLDAGSAASRTQADRLIDAARMRLARWEVTPEQMESADGGAVEPLIEFRAPASGIVAEKRVVEGARVMPGELLYRLIDLSSVWIEAQVYEADLPFIKPGQAGTVTLEALPGEVRRGRVTFVAPSLDAATRTAVVRLELPNPGGRLRPGMFATVELDIPIGDGLTVPGDAVVDTGRQQFVFVAEGDGYFDPRPVRVGHQTDGRVQVLEGLAEGDRVATSATFFLDSESQLRAGLQDYQAAPTAEPGTATRSQLSITLATRPDPPRAGRAVLEVAVADAEGRPVADAAVTVTFFMPAMPSMNMPAMKSEAALTGAGGGTYRGEIDVLMGGRWDVAITVMRGDERLGSRQLTLLAR